MNSVVKMETNNQVKLIQVKEIASKLMPNLSYHNFGHAIDVYTTVSNLADLENVSEKDKFLLQTAALLHDILFKRYNPYNNEENYNEERSAEAVRKYLPFLSYPKEQVEKIAKLILATKWPTDPKNLLEKIVCDGDLDSLGRKDFFEKSERYRQELGLPKEEWHQKQLQFLQTHQYYTESIRKLRDKNKQENIEKFKKLFGKNDKRKT